MRKILKQVLRFGLPVGQVALLSTPLAPLAALIPTFVRGAEVAFGAKTGETKFQLVSGMVMLAADKLARAGKIPRIPSDDELHNLIEQEVALMQVAEHNDKAVVADRDELLVGLSMVLKSLGRWKEQEG